MKNNLLDLIDLSDSVYEKVKMKVAENAQVDFLIFPTLDAARVIIRENRPGAQLLRYLMLRMRNQILKDQYKSEPCKLLSELCVSWSCIPFDTMPFCTSPLKHNPSFADLAASIDMSEREHELLARYVRTNVEQHGVIYTQESDLEEFGDLDTLIDRYNDMLPRHKRHLPRKLERANGHVFMKGYEDDTVKIIERLQEISSDGIEVIQKMSRYGLMKMRIFQMVICIKLTMRKKRRHSGNSSHSRR
ncbi:hypothetical protein V5T06_01425 [Corynebacterium mastitidis]